jgi:chromosome segregation ATPase
MDTARGIEGGSDGMPFAQQSMRYSPSSPERTAAWLAAAVLAAALAPGAQAQTTNSAELQAGPEQEQARTEKLARELAAARQDVMSLQTRFNQEREHAALLEQDLAKGSAELRQALQKEQKKTETLAQELATARARIYAFEAQARQSSEQTVQLEGGAADLRTSLQQERDRASRLEQDVAAARRDVEKQTALAARAGEEAREMKQAADSAGELQKSLEQEQDRAARLEEELAAARRDLEKHTARAARAKAGRATRTAWSLSNFWRSIFAPPRR